MKYIYILNVRMTGINGSIIKCVDSAYEYEHDACETAEKMWDHRPKNDPNYLTWVNGPIPLIEED